MSDVHAGGRFGATVDVLMGGSLSMYRALFKQTYEAVDNWLILDRVRP